MENFNWYQPIICILVDVIQAKIVYNTRMSARLCAGCKVIHKRPWDDQCKTVLANLQKQAETANQEEFQAQATSPKGAGNEHLLDPQIKAYKELIGTVKGFSAQMQGYEKKINELSALVTAKSPTAKRPRTISDPHEPVFTSPAQAKSMPDETSPTDKSTNRKGVRLRTTNPQAAISTNAPHQQLQKAHRANSSGQDQTNKTKAASHSDVVELVHVSPKDSTHHGLSQSHMQQVNISASAALGAPHAAMACPQDTTQSQWGAPSALDSHNMPWGRQGPPAQQMHELRTNPQLHGVATERMSNVEGQAQSIPQGRVTGRCNIKGPQDPNPLTRWPNENFPIGEGMKRPSFDDLSLSQFVSGMLSRVLDLHLPMHRLAMLNEVKAIMDTATSSGWPVAKSIFGEVMAKIETGKIQWTDSYSLWQARVDAKADVAMSNKQDNSQRAYGMQHYGQLSNTKAKRQSQMFRTELPCKNFNWNFCKEHGDHDDIKLPQRYVHVCIFCMNRPEIKDKRHKAKKCPHQGNPQ